MATNRREFIQIGGAGLGAAALGSGLTTKWWGLDPDVVHDPGTDGDRVVPTFCELCFWKCGVLAHVKDGKVTKISGNPEHPLSRGKLCPRGTGGTGLLYDPDRLKQPLLRRREARASRTSRRSPGTKALDFVAEKLAQIKKVHGPESRRPLLPRLRRVVLQAPAQGLRLAERHGPLLRASAAARARSAST